MIKSKQERVLILLAVLLASLSLFSCGYLNEKAGLKDDNLYEEIIEELLDYKTGLDVDLTPENAE